MHSYFRYSQTVALSQGNANLQPTPLCLEGCFFIALPILLPLMLACYRKYSRKYRRIMQNRQIERLERLRLINVVETTV
jgi:hypothetical protein